MRERYSAYDVDPSELFLCYFKHVGEIFPDPDVCLDECHFGIGLVFIHELLRFWPQGEVGDQDVAFARYECFCEAEVDPCRSGQYKNLFYGRESVVRIPDPAPVMSAVLPSTLKGTAELCAVILE